MSLLLNIELKEYLDEKVTQYNSPNFIESDPIQIPHQYDLKEDIEISGFLTATIAWGNRTMIIKNGHKMMQMMGGGAMKKKSYAMGGMTGKKKMSGGGSASKVIKGPYS